MAAPLGPVPIESLTPDQNKSLVNYIQQTHSLLSQHWNIRTRLQDADKNYMRENNQGKEHQRADYSNRLGDSSRIQDPVPPIVMSMVDSAVATMGQVFLTDPGIFTALSDPSQQDAADQLNSINIDTAIRAGWARQFLLCFKDGFKYGLMGMECDWCEETTYSLETDPGVSTTQGTPKKVLWAYNKLRRVDMYNAIFDIRVPPAQVHTDGEFAGYVELMSRIQLKRFIGALPTTIHANIVPAFESGAGGAPFELFYYPQINPKALLNVNPRQATDWMAWAVADSVNKIRYNNMYQVTTLYARIMPADFGLKIPSAKTPQIWKFVLINNDILVHVRQVTNAHNYLPIIFGQPTEDGLNYQTKSYGDNAEPFQQIAAALWAARMASARRRVVDRAIYNPLYISESNINSDSPTAKIPVKPAAYGKPLNEIYYQIPMNEQNEGLYTQEAQQMVQFAQQALGSNNVSEGQFQKGNKLQDEFNAVMANAGAKVQMAGIMIEAQFMTPIKEIIKLNILQYQQPDTYHNPALGQNVAIDPLALRQAAMTFKVSDGLNPASKFVDANFALQIVQLLGANPAMQQQFDFAGAISYICSLKNVKELKQFIRTPEQVAQVQQNQMVQDGSHPAVAGQTAQAEAAGTAKGTPPQQASQQQAPPQGPQK